MGKEGEREGEKHGCERETSNSWLLLIPDQATEPQPKPCANLLLCVTTPNQLHHPGRGSIIV